MTNTVDLTSSIYHFLSFISYLVYFLFLWCLSFILVIFIMFILRKSLRKRSFQQIHSEFNLEKESKRISALRRLHFYLQTCTFEEFIIFNLKWKGIKYFPYLYYFFLALFTLFFFLIFIIFSSIFMFYPHSFLLYIMGVTLIIIFIGPTLITSMPIFILRAIGKKEKILKNSWPQIVLKYIFHVAENLIVNIPIILFTFLISLMIVSLFNYLSSAHIQGVMSDFIKTTNMIQSNYLIYPINYLTNLYNYLSKFDINDQSVKSNQLSFAGFYFTLAVGGTVVLSIIHFYYEKADSLKKQLESQIDSFNELYTKYNSHLSLTFSDIINFDYTKIKELKFKGIVSFNYKKIKDFAYSHLQIRKIMNCEEIESKKDSLTMFNTFIWDVIITYVLGIITVLIPETFASLLFWIFIVNSILFGFSLYFTYQTYVTETINND